LTTVYAAAAVKFPKLRKPEELVRNLKEKETIWYQTRDSLLDFLDLVWVPEGDHIFHEQSNTTPDEALAAILIIGEDEDIIQIMDIGYASSGESTQGPQSRGFFQARKDPSSSSQPFWCCWPLYLVSQALRNTLAEPWP
jgi:hypothetical protein